MTAALAIDLGGTKTLTAIVDGPNVLDRHLASTDRATGPEDWLNAAVEAAKRWRGRYRHIGITVTGLVSDSLWRPLNLETLPLPAEGYPLAARAEELFGSKVTLCNDAQAAAWGEHIHGAGCGRDMAFLTVSTGIGAGLVLGGRLLSGRFGLAGHAGQLVAMPDGDETPFEDMASGRWIAQEVDAANARAVFESENAQAHKAIETSARRVARLCRNLQFLLAPEVILIGGGVGLASGYLPKLHSELSPFDDIRRPHLEPAELGADAGIIGIADLAASAGQAGPAD